MNWEDFFIPAPEIAVEEWQLGNRLSPDITEGSVVLLFCGEERGSGAALNTQNFNALRRQLYQLSFPGEGRIVDPGDFIPGKTLSDTRYALREVLSYIRNQKAIPVLIGGSADLCYDQYEALTNESGPLEFTLISNRLWVEDDLGVLSDRNFLYRILSDPRGILQKFHHLGNQRHLNNAQTGELLDEVDFDVIPLSGLIRSAEEIEPFFRRADWVSFDCNAVESFAEAFSIDSQVNGLNRREICALTKEAGLSQNLKMAGFFNFNRNTKQLLNRQLMAQMLWYFLEGVFIAQTHPKGAEFETHWVMIGEHEVAFQRDVFSNLWYFGSDEDLNKCLPCSNEDFRQAKDGFLSERLLKFLR